LKNLSSLRDTNGRSGNAQQAKGMGAFGGLVEHERGVLCLTGRIALL
jgi:hypothetical protein